MQTPSIYATQTHTVTASERFGFVDLTPALEAAVEGAGLGDGLCVSFCRHTTCGLMINEWEDGAQEDLIKRLDVLVPEGAYYAHDDLDRRTQNLVPDERANGRSHVMQMLVGGNSQTIPVAHGEVLLGRWQRLFLLELDEPKPREIVFACFGTGRTSTESAVPRLETWTLERSR
jgi:secondary thiamine-phosphate synthase enzyme